MDSDKTLTSDVSYAQDIGFRRFKDQGLVLNTQGYKGGIEVKDCIFTANIAYIQEVLLHESLETDTYMNFDDKLMISDYSDNDKTFLKFKTCVDDLWYANYLF